MLQNTLRNDVFQIFIGVSLGLSLLLSALKRKLMALLVIKKGPRGRHAKSGGIAMEEPILEKMTNCNSCFLHIMQ